MLSLGRGCAFLFVLLIAVPALGADLRPEIEKRVRQAAVQVWMGEAQEGEEDAKWMGSGSGSFINRRGLVVTNNHVIDPGHGKSVVDKFQARIAASVLKYKVVVNGGTEAEKEYRALVLFQNESADLAILQIQEKSGDPLESPYYLRLFPSRHLAVNGSIWIFGFPGGDKMASRKDKHAEVTVDQGNILDLPTRPGGRIVYVKTDLKGAPGNSGGPAVNADGDLIGVVSQLATSLQSPDGLEIRLVPGDLVADMVKVSLGLEKVSDQTDLEPFLHLLARKDGRVVLPGSTRDDKQASIFFSNGGETKATISSDTLAIKTNLGSFQIPTKYAAYAVAEEGTMNFLMDGGDRLRASASDVELEFETTRSGKSKQPMSTMRRVAFRDARAPLHLEDVEALLLEGEGCRIIIHDVQGTARFKLESGKTLELGLDELTMIDTEAYKQRVHTVDGSVLTGKFEPHSIKATLTRLGAPIEAFSLEHARNMTIEPVSPAKSNRSRLTLAMRLAIDDSDLKRVADWIEDLQLVKAEDLLRSKLDKDLMKSKPKPMQEQARALEAELLLRQGKYQEAAQGFKKIRRASLEHVRWYADGRFEILDRHPDGTYAGRPLSDPAVFNDAATEMAEVTVQESHGRRTAYRGAMPDAFNDWRALTKKLDDSENDLLRADSLNPGSSEHEIFFNWRFSIELTGHQWQQLQEEQRDLGRKVEDFRNDGSKSSRDRQEALERKRDRLQDNFKDLQRFIQGIQEKMQDAGFRLDDESAAQFLSTRS